MNKRVLSVGNCAADHRAISGLLEKQFAAQVVPANSLSTTLEQLRSESYALVLVNRILDLDGSDGLKVIAQIKADAALRHVPVMMITNFPEHQQVAQLAGAVEGFGKQALGTPETVARLAPFLT